MYLTLGDSFVRLKNINVHLPHRFVVRLNICLIKKKKKLSILNYVFILFYYFGIYDHSEPHQKRDLRSSIVKTKSLNYFSKFQTVDPSDLISFKGK